MTSTIVRGREEDDNNNKGRKKKKNIPKTQQNNFKEPGIKELMDPKNIYGSNYPDLVD